MRGTEMRGTEMQDTSISGIREGRSWVSLGSENENDDRSVKSAGLRTKQVLIRVQVVKYCLYSVQRIRILDRIPENTNQL